MAASNDPPGSTQRKLRLKWADLIERRGFTGQHLAWHQSERNRRLRQTKQLWADEITFSPDHSEAVDHIGTAETIDLAKERFKQKQAEILTIWAQLPETRSEHYDELLTRLRGSVIQDVASLWRGEWHAAWFIRACKQKIEEALGQLQREEVNRVRRIEITHLENPHVRLVDLIASKGSVYYAEIHKRQDVTIRNATETLDLWKLAGELAPLESADGKVAPLPAKTSEEVAAVAAHTIGLAVGSDAPKADPVANRRARSGAAGKRASDLILSTIRHKIRDLRALSITTTEEICKEMKTTPTPPNAAWSGQTWLDAYRNKKHRNAVKRWISSVK